MSLSWMGKRDLKNLHACGDPQNVQDLVSQWELSMTAVPQHNT